MEKKKQRQLNATSQQKKILLEFIKKRPQFASGKFSNEFTHKDSQLLWKEITQILNNCPGANKDWKSWRKTWQDIRSRTKTKRGKYLAERNKTGGSPYEEVPITGYEADVLDIIKPVSVYNPNIIKSPSATEIMIPKVRNMDDVTPKTTPSDFSKASQNSPQKKCLQVFLPNETIVTHMLTTESLNEEYILTEPKSSATESITPNKDKNIHIIPQDTSSDLPKVFQKGSRKKFQQATATENYRVSLENKNKIKNDYYQQKIDILKRLVIAKERSAAAKERSVLALEKIADNLGQLSSAVNGIRDNTLS